MRNVFLAVAMTGLCAAGLNGQSTETKAKSQTKIEVKDGKMVTVSGCVERHPGATGLMLTNVADRNSEFGNYLLVGKTDELDDHVGHFVEITGKITDHKKGKVETRTKTEIEREDAEDTQGKSKTELKGNLEGVPLLGVQTVRMIRASCL